MSGRETEFAALLDAVDAALERDDLESAESLLRRIIPRSPLRAPPLANLGQVLLQRGRLGQAEVMFRRAIAAMPTHDPRASQFIADVRLLLAMATLAQGKLRTGWPLLSTRSKSSIVGGDVQFSAAEWKGDPLRGKSLVIYPEWGFGDQIQLARFAPWLQSQGVEVFLGCQPALARLFQTMDVEVVTTGIAGFSDRVPTVDKAVMMLDVPRWANITFSNLPTAPYLPAPSPTTPLGARVGVVTNGSPTHDNDRHRTLPNDLKSRLLSLPGAISLAPDDTGAADFFDTAALIAGLDLVISVDTSVAHLAAAMGKPVWILIPAFNTDWRWMRGRTDSPWYPSAKLYRQETPGDWCGVLDRVERDAQLFLADKMAA